MPCCKDNSYDIDLCQRRECPILALVGSAYGNLRITVSLCDCMIRRRVPTEICSIKDPFVEQDNTRAECNPGTRTWKVSFRNPSGMRVLDWVEQRSRIDRIRLTSRRRMREGHSLEARASRSLDSQWEELGKALSGVSPPRSELSLRLRPLSKGSVVK